MFYLSLGPFSDSESCSVTLNLPCLLQKEYTPFNMQNMFLIVGLLEVETKKERIIAENIEICHICLGTRHNKM
jgi:hypothetical protein